MAEKHKADNIDIHVGQRVRLRRLMLQMTQTELANRLGITFQQVQKYEKGSNRIGAGRLYRTAQILDVPPGFFFEDMPGAKGHPGRGRSLPEYLVGLMGTASGQRLTEAFARISDARMRNIFVELLNAMAGEKSSPLRRRKPKVNGK